jgi:hypothetical protein
MEVRGAGGETTQDRPLDLANVVEFAIDQSGPRSLVVLQLLVGRPVTGSVLHTVMFGG